MFQYWSTIFFNLFSSVPRFNSMHPYVVFITVIGNTFPYMLPCNIFGRDKNGLVYIKRSIFHM